MKRLALVSTLLLSVALLLAACDDSGVDSPTAQPSALDGTSGPTFTPPAELQTAIATFEQASPPPPATPTAGALRAPEVAAAEDLAVRLEQSVDAITVVSVVAVDWPDSCLDAGQQGEVCEQVVTPGFEVVLQIGATTYTYHTNQDGTVARFAGVSIENGGTGEEG